MYTDKKATFNKGRYKVIRGLCVLGAIIGVFYGLSKVAEAATDNDSTDPEDVVIEVAKN